MDSSTFKFFKWCINEIFFIILKNLINHRNKLEYICKWKICFYNFIWLLRISGNTSIFFNSFTILFNKNTIKYSFSKIVDVITFQKSACFLKKRTNSVFPLSSFFGKYLGFKTNKFWITKLFPFKNQKNK